MQIRIFKMKIFDNFFKKLAIILSQFFFRNTL